MGLNIALKNLAAHLPLSWQTNLKKIHFRLDMVRGQFCSDEPEFRILSKLIQPGDWALDIGANVGHYTIELARLCGVTGRVIAFEPVPETFSILTSNLLFSGKKNVSLLNVAASNSSRTAKISIPKSANNALANYYRASLIVDPRSDQQEILCITVDALGLDQKISVVKIDAEGHEPAVLAGMVGTLQKSRPFLIVEDNVSELKVLLTSQLYSAIRLKGSPNLLAFHHQDKDKLTKEIESEEFEAVF